MAVKPKTADAALAKGEKLRLNDEQWKRLQSLANCQGSTAASEQTRGSCRLKSNGLVATDRKGREYLTLFGMHRLDQGR